MKQGKSALLLLAVALLRLQVGQIGIGVTLPLSMSARVPDSSKHRSDGK
jgi:hypothetical protein